MEKTGCWEQRPWMRVARCGLAIWLVVGCLSSVSRLDAAEPETTRNVADSTASFWDVLHYLAPWSFDSRALIQTLSRPEYTVAGFLLLAAVIFTETGLLVGFFLPGDSLLVTAGVVCFVAGW